MTADRRPWTRVLRCALLAVLLPVLGACTVHINMVPPVRGEAPAPAARVEAAPDKGEDKKARRAPSRVRNAPEKAPTRPRVLVGDWLEQWPDRLGCKDTARVSVAGQKIEIAGSDCNNGKVYEITEEVFDGRFLRFRLRVPETKYDLFYKLELVEQGVLEGDVTGSVQAHVKWLKL